MVQRRRRRESLEWGGTVGIQSSKGLVQDRGLGTLWPGDVAAEGRKNGGGGNPSEKGHKRKSLKKKVGNDTLDFRKIWRKV